MTKPVLCLNSIRGKSGKDTLIGLLKSCGHSVFRVAFADILKKQCALVLAYTVCEAETYERDMHSAKKDAAQGNLSIWSLPDSPYKNFMVDLARYSPASLEEPRSLRWHLQKYGTEYCREFLKAPDVWCEQGIREVNKGLASDDYDIVVVTDMRLPNEYEGLTGLDLYLKAGKPKTIRIIRDWFVPGVDDQAYHISDIALMAHPFDALVVNRLGEPWAMLDQLKEQGVIK